MSEDKNHTTTYAGLIFVEQAKSVDAIHGNFATADPKQMSGLDS